MQCWYPKHAVVPAGQWVLDTLLESMGGEIQQ
jgi:hypothetical protein